MHRYVILFPSAAVIFIQNIS